MNRTALQASPPSAVAGFNQMNMSEQQRNSCMDKKSGKYEGSIVQTSKRNEAQNLMTAILLAIHPFS